MSYDEGPWNLHASYGPPPQPPVQPAYPPPPFPPRPSKARKLLPWIIAAVAVAVAASVAVGATSGTKKAAANHSPPPTVSTNPATTDSSVPVTDETTDTPTPTPSSISGKVGETFTIDQDDTPAAKITVVKVASARVEPGEFGQSPERGLYLVITLKAVGTGASFDVNPFDFYVRGADGGHYEDTTYSDAWGPTFESGTLHNGEHISGTMVYDVSPHATHGSLVYAPNFDGEAIASWSY